ncbi:MAG: hypothetical protein ACR2MP_30065 [Streptosporangiaceae bacterium]
MALAIFLLMLAMVMLVLAGAPAKATPLPGEEGTQRMVLPVGRRGRTRASLDGDLGQQIRGTGREAGVRRQL